MPIKKSLKILIVDANEKSAYMTRQIFKNIGFSDMEHVVSIQEDDAELKVYELIICSDDIGGITCEDFILKARSVNRCPILVITGNAEQTQVMKYVKAGMSAFIVKPFSTESIIKKLGALLK